MASANSLVVEDDLLCPICLSVFTEPVSILCRHNFCLDCIAKYWDSVKDGEYECPVCKDASEKRPRLRVNIFIAELVKKFKDTSKQVEPPCPGQTVEVPCGACPEPKQAAVKSCLECVMSFCGAHLDLHCTIPDLKKHKLIDPVDDLDSRSCEKHHKLLVLFCVADQEFICESCKGRGHQNHTIITQEAVAQVLNAQIDKDKMETTQMIRARQQKMQEIQNSLQVKQSGAAMALSCSQQAITAVADYIKRSQTELAEVIKNNLDRAENEAKDLLQELDREIMQIKQKKSKLDELWHPDPFTFVKKFRSAPITLPLMTDWTGVTLKGDQFVTPRTMTRLEETMMKEMSMLCDPDLKEKWQYAVDISLDANTANPYLKVSADGKQVSHANGRLSLPNDQQRFDQVLNVMGKEGFGQGRFYFEVQVKDKTQWILGVAKSSINRKGDTRLSPQNGYWTIWLRQGPEFIANKNPPVDLMVRKTLQKVGVFVDYQQGQVSFYDVEARANIFSFTECHFKENLFPFLSPGKNDSGKNSAPLIITPITHKI